MGLDHRFYWKRSSFRHNYPNISITGACVESNLHFIFDKVKSNQ